MATPNDSTTAYCTPAQMVARYDVRTLGDLLSDNDARLPPGAVLTNPYLLQLLGEASGELESACLRGSRYGADDIRAVVARGGNGAEMIAGIVAGYALCLLWERRPDRTNGKDLPGTAALQVAKLDLLSKGERILPLQETADAGLPNSFVLSPAQVFQQNLATTEAYRFFGQRGNQMGSRR